MDGPLREIIIRKIQPCGDKDPAVELQQILDIFIKRVEVIKNQKILWGKVLFQKPKCGGIIVSCGGRLCFIGRAAAGVDLQRTLTERFLHGVLER